MIEGGCRCGATRYTLALDAPLPIYACHCRDCQTMSGSAFAMQLPAPQGALDVTGDLVSWKHPSRSGSEAVQYFCATCRTRLYSTNGSRPGVVIVRAGTLDASDALVPKLHIWTKRKQPWVDLPPGIPAFAESAPPAAFIAILMG
jgi:hypothetical protein